MKTVNMNSIECCAKKKLCRNMKINPVSGKSTMSFEERNKMFNF